MHRNTAYNGGFCRFWFIPVEEVLVMPRINAATQYLVDEPSIRPGAAWLGPIAVPRDRIGFSEEFKRTAAGHYYVHKIEGIHPGESAESRVNFENLPYHKYLAIGKMRAGGFYCLVGTKDSPLSFNPEFRGGLGPGDIAQNLFSFSTNHISKAYVLPQFTADAIASGLPGNGPGDGSGNGGNTMAQKETIPFQNQPTISIPWTPLRQNRFGNFPIVQVWLIEDGGVPYKANAGSIEVDAPPPAFTELTVRLGGNPTGFIEIM